MAKVLKLMSNDDEDNVHFFAQIAISGVPSGN